LNSSLCYIFWGEKPRKLFHHVALGFLVRKSTAEERPSSDGKGVNCSGVGATGTLLDLSHGSFDPDLNYCISGGFRAPPPFGPKFTIK
jgi:hypothetical protein